MVLRYTSREAANSNARLKLGPLFRTPVSSERKNLQLLSFTGKTAVALRPDFNHTVETLQPTQVALLKQ